MTELSKIPKKAEDEAIEWLCKLNRSDLSSEDISSFQQWLSSSALHQAAYVKAEGLWANGELLRLEPARGGPILRWWRSAWGGVKHPALTYSFGLVFLGVVFVLSQWLVSGRSEPETYHLVAGVGELNIYDLPDGSHLEVNTNSQLTVELAKHVRTAKLVKGEVFFNVESDMDRPFEVITRHGVVRVVGTQFSVYQTDTDVIVTVLEGRVRLQPKSVTDPNVKEFLLKGGESIHLEAVGRGQLPEHVNVQSELSWRNRHIVFEGTPLAKAVKDINRYFSEDIVLDEDPEQLKLFREIQVTGILMLSDLSAVMEFLGAFDLYGVRDTSGKKVKIMRRTSQDGGVKERE